MDRKSGKLRYWRNYFRSANSDIFEVIEHAITVAASDCPEEFQKRRDRIAVKLFSCQMRRCLECERIELAVPQKEEDDGFNGGQRGDGGGKESKVTSSTDDRGELNSVKWVSNYSYDEAEALTEELEEESLTVGEVTRIKGVLENGDESVGVLFESLRRLQLMELSVDILKVTEIGKAVSSLRKHGSKHIRQLARALVKGWMDMVDKWVDATAAIARCTPESVNPLVVDEDGLPFPPLDEGAFFTTQTTSMELSGFFDIIDDDGNPQNAGDFNKNFENGTEPVLENYDHTRDRQNANEAYVPKDDKSQIRKQDVVVKQTKPSHNNSRRGRPLTFSSDRNAKGDTRLRQQPELLGIQKKPPTGEQDKTLSPDELIQLKLEASGRNLQERYQQVKNAKKQRTIQVMELRDLPKEVPDQRNSHFKPGMHNRHWANRHC